MYFFPVKDIVEESLKNYMREDYRVASFQNGMQPVNDY